MPDQAISMDLVFWTLLFVKYKVNLVKFLVLIKIWMFGDQQRDRLGTLKAHHHLEKVPDQAISMDLAFWTLLFVIWSKGQPGQISRPPQNLHVWRPAKRLTGDLESLSPP